MTLLSTALTAKLAEFGVRLAIALGWKFNDGPFHRHAEKRRRAIQARELKRQAKESENEK
jgi:phosphoserine phosphatase